MCRFALYMFINLVLFFVWNISPDKAVAETGRGEAFRYVLRLARGINLGNALDAPEEGLWGVTLEAGYFKTIKAAGFNAVRIPVRWSAHADGNPPYAVDRAFLDRVDWAIEQALSQGLFVVVDFHHYEEMSTRPGEEQARFITLWGEVARHYQTWPSTLSFELLNEPEGELTDARWAKLVPMLLQTIRQSNPRRMVIVGPGQQYDLKGLDRLNLPAKDDNLIVTFHYYEPAHFTHQGADWVEGSAAWLGTRWAGSVRDRRALHDDFAKVAAWSMQHNRPIYLGEFGSHRVADMPSRQRWTRAVAEEAESNGFAWAYWEFCSVFGAYDADRGRWRQPLLRALMDRD